MKDLSESRPCPHASLTHCGSSSILHIRAHTLTGCQLIMNIDLSSRQPIKVPMPERKYKLQSINSSFWQFLSSLRSVRSIVDARKKGNRASSENVLSRALDARCSPPPDRTISHGVSRSFVDGEMYRLNQFDCYRLHNHNGSAANGLPFTEPEK